MCGAVLPWQFRYVINNLCVSTLHAMARLSIRDTAVADDGAAQGGRLQHVRIVMALAKP